MLKEQVNSALLTGKMEQTGIRAGDTLWFTPNPHGGDGTMRISRARGRKLKLLYGNLLRNQWVAYPICSEEGFRGLVYLLSAFLNLDCTLDINPTLCRADFKKRKG